MGHSRLIALALVALVALHVAYVHAAPAGIPDDVWNRARSTGKVDTLKAASETDPSVANEWSEWIGHAEELDAGHALRVLRRTYVPPTSQEWKVLTRMIVHEFKDVTAVVAGALAPHAITSREHPWAALNAIAIVREAVMVDASFLRSDDNAVRAALLRIAGHESALLYTGGDNAHMLKANGRDRIVWRAGDLLLAEYADECSPAQNKDGAWDEKQAASGKCPLGEPVLQSLFKDVLAHDATLLSNTYNVLVRRVRAGHNLPAVRWALELQPDVNEWKVARSGHGLINAIHAYPTVAWYNAASIALLGHKVNRVTGNRNLRAALEELLMTKLPSEQLVGQMGDTMESRVEKKIDAFQKVDATSRALPLEKRSAERKRALDDLKLAVHQARVMAARVLAAMSTQLEGEFGENLGKVKRQNKQGAWIEANYYNTGAGIPATTLSKIDRYAAQAAAQGPGMKEACQGQTDSREAVWAYVLRRTSPRVKSAAALEAIVDAVLHNAVLHDDSPAWTAVRTWYSAVNPRRQLYDALKSEATDEASKARAARAARAMFEYARWSKEDGHVSGTRAALYNLMLRDDVTDATVKWAARTFMFVHQPHKHELEVTEELALLRAVMEETTGDADVERSFIAKQLAKQAYQAAGDAPMRDMLLRWLTGPGQPDDVYIRLASLLSSAPSAATPAAVKALVALVVGDVAADPAKVAVLAQPDTSVVALSHSLAAIGAAHGCATNTKSARCRALTTDARLEVLRAATAEFVPSTMSFAEDLVAAAGKAGGEAAAGVEKVLLSELQRAATRGGPAVRLEESDKKAVLAASDAARVVHLFHQLPALSHEASVQLAHFGGKLLLQPAVAVLRDHALRAKPSATAVAALDLAYYKAMEGAQVPSLGLDSLWEPNGLVELMKRAHKTAEARARAFADHDRDGDDANGAEDADEETAAANGARLGAFEAERVFAQVIVDVVFATAFRPEYRRALFAQPHSAWLPLKFAMRLPRVLAVAHVPSAHADKSAHQVKHALNDALKHMSLSDEVAAAVHVWRKLNNLAVDRSMRTVPAGRAARAFERLYMPGTVWRRSARELVGDLAASFAGSAAKSVTSADRAAMCTIMRAFTAEQELVVAQYGDEADELGVRSPHYFRAVQWLLYKRAGGDGALGAPARTEFAKCLGNSMLDALLDAADTADADEHEAALRSLDTIAAQLTLGQQRSTITKLIALADVESATRRRGVCQVLDGFHADAFTTAHLTALSKVVRARVYTEGRMTGAAHAPGKMLRRWGDEAMPFAHVLARAIRSTTDEVRVAAAQAWLDNAWPTVPKDIFKGLMDVAMRVPSRDARMVGAIRRQFPTVSMAYSKEVADRYYTDVLKGVADEQALRPYIARAWTHPATWETVDKVSAPVELRELGNNLVTRRDLQRITTGVAGEHTEETVALARRMLDLRMYPVRRVDVLLMNEQPREKPEGGDKHYVVRRRALQRYCVRHTAPQKDPYWMTLSGIVKAVPAAYSALQSAGEGVHTSFNYLFGDSASASKRRVARDEAQKLKARGIKADAPAHVKAGIGYLLYEDATIAYGAWPTLKRIDTRHIGCRDSDNRTMAIDVTLSRPQGGSFTRRTRTTGEEDEVPYLAVDTLVHASGKPTSKTVLMQIESPDTKGNHGLGLGGVDGVVAVHAMWNAAKRFSYGYVMAFQEAYRNGPSAFAGVGMRATMSALGEADFAHGESADMDATTSPESLVQLLLARKELDVREDVHMSRVIEFTNGKPDRSTTNFVVFADRAKDADVTTRREEVVLTRVAGGGAKTWDLQLPNRTDACPKCVSRQTFFQGTTDTMKQMHWVDGTTGLVWKTTEKDLSQQRKKMRDAPGWKSESEAHLPTSREFALSISSPQPLALTHSGGAQERVHKDALRNVWLPATVRKLVPVQRFIAAADEPGEGGRKQTIRFVAELKSNSKDGKMRANDRRTVTVTSSAGHRLRIVQDMLHFDAAGKPVAKLPARVQDRVSTAAAYERAGSAAEALAARVTHSRVTYCVQAARGEVPDKTAVELYDAYDKEGKRVLATGTGKPVGATLLRAVTVDDAAKGKLVYVTPQQAAAQMKEVLESLSNPRPTGGNAAGAALAEREGVHTAAHMAQVTLMMERVNKYLGGAAGKVGSVASAYEWLYKGARLVNPRDWRAVAAHSAQLLGLDLGRIDTAARDIVRGIDAKLGRHAVDFGDMPPTRAWYKREFGPFTLPEETSFADFAAKHKYNAKYALMIRARGVWVDEALNDAAKAAKGKFTDRAAAVNGAVEGVKKGVEVVNTALKALQEATEAYALLHALERGDSSAAYAYMMKKGPVVAGVVIDQFKKAIKAELDVMNTWAKSYVQRNGATVMRTGVMLEFAEREFALQQLEDATKVLGVVTGTWDVLKEGTRWLKLRNKRGRDFDTFVAGTKASLGGMTVVLSAAGLATTPVGWALAVVSAADAVHSHVESTKIAPLQISSPVLEAK